MHASRVEADGRPGLSAGVCPEALGPVLASAMGDERWEQFSFELIVGGKSNLTFELRSDAGSLILRRPPLGAILHSAHDMSREARVQRALRGTDVPVPTIVFADTEGEIIGSPFYVMEKVAGHVIRDVLPPDYAATEADKLALADALIDTLVALHSVDPGSVGLGDYGRPVGFVERQLRRWGTQWERSKTRDLPVLDELAATLRRRLPEESGKACLLHGDYRLDNCLMDVIAPGRVAAVLDWELSARGDPMTDLAMLLFYWREEGEPAPLLSPAVTRHGFPTRAHLAERYLSATGLAEPDLAFFEGFAHFKFAVIAQGIAARVAAGAMGDQHFGDVDAEVSRIAADGLARLRHGE